MPNFERPIFNSDGVAQPHLAPQYHGIQPAKPDMQYVTTRRSPLIDPPDASWPFIAAGVVTIPPIGQSVVVCQETIAKGMTGVIWRVANGSAINPIDGWINGNGALLWKILRNGQVYQYFNTQTVLFGLVEEGGSPLMAPLRGAEGETLGLVLYNISLPAEGQISPGLLSGYQFPKSLDPSTRR